MRDYFDLIVKTAIAIAVLAIILTDAFAVFGGWRAHDSAQTVADAAYKSYQNLGDSKQAEASAVQTAREYQVQLTRFGVENQRVVVQIYVPVQTTFLVKYVPSLKEYLGGYIWAYSPK